MSNNTRFVLRSDMFGVHVFDTWYMVSVRDGKGSVIVKPESQRAEVQEICDVMNERTEDIPFESGSVAA